MIRSPRSFPSGHIRYVDVFDVLMNCLLCTPMFLTAIVIICSFFKAMVHQLLGIRNNRVSLPEASKDNQVMFSRLLFIVSVASFTSLMLT